MSEKFKVLWTDNALIDLENIRDFHNQIDDTLGKKVVASIIKSTVILESFPNSGRYHESNFTLRTIISGYFKIFYSVSKQIVFIKLVFDTRQNPSKLRVEP